MSSQSKSKEVTANLVPNSPPSSLETNRELKAGPPPTFLIPLNIAFYLCLTSHVLAALYAPIADCDETFNYWEPLHYILHGYGLQTWEYSPEFSIRSWAYIVIHALPAKFASLLGKSKTFEFYFVRCLLGAVCAASETRLFSAISKSLSPRIAVFYLMVVAFTPGFFYASVAFLPSSFAMYTSSLGLAAFLDRKRGENTARGIMWFAIGALLGWPFAGALIVPFVAEDFINALIFSDVSATFKQYINGATRSLIILAGQIAVDSLFYQQMSFVAWQIVSYNIFSSGDKGPDIFGTEPWHFYLRNLLLNFNLWMMLAFAALPLVLFHAIFSGQGLTKQRVSQTVVLTTPFYMWFAIFTLQPHKEERFMFPAYPFLGLNAAIALHTVLVAAGTSDPKSTFAKIPPRVKLITVLFPVLIAINIGLLRITGTITAYRAPIQIMETFASLPGITASDTLCVGKEWYRFPSSFFLANRSHAKFIRSEFDGLLPGQFVEIDGLLGFLEGARRVPAGMNDRNEEDPGKYTSLNSCSFLFDSQLPSWKPTAREPEYTISQDWQKVACLPFLDASSTSLLARMIWVPSIAMIPKRFQRSWGEFCLLKKTTAKGQV